jgi:MFS family permease
MPTLREVIAGQWRAVPILGVTQIIAWGALFYPPVLTVPMIAAERGWSMTLAMGGFSLALLAAGLASPQVGRLIDRHGGHRVMPAGSLIGALGLVLLIHADHPLAYLSVWMLLGVAIAASLYDPAFATLGRIFGAAARRPITALTLIGGFASTVSWPATHLLLDAVGWRGTYLVYAGLLAFVAAPLHALLLPRTRADPRMPAQETAALTSKMLKPSGWPFVLVAAAFAAYAFVPSGLSAHLLAIFRRAGIEPATVVTIGALFGPAQVVSRLIEFVATRRVHPLNVARFAIGMLLAAFAQLAVLGLSVASAAAFVMMFGMANGLITIARGAVPLALFGAVGFGHLVGRIGRASLVMQAIAPLVLALVAERGSDAAVLAVVAAFAMVSFCGLALVRRPAANGE